jgi:hypothetical protein
MKSVLISIQPKWCELIASGKKTVEIRKTKPKLDPPFKVYIYCTIGDGANGDILPQSRVTCGKVIGEFMCDFITPFRPKALLGDSQIVKASCVKIGDLIEYAPNKPFPQDHIYGWHITDLVIYDKPKELSKFCSYDARTYIGENGYPMPTHEITRPPQSWCYVEGGE